MLHEEGLVGEAGVGPSGEVGVVRRRRFEAAEDVVEVGSACFQVVVVVSISELADKEKKRKTHPLSRRSEDRRPRPPRQSYSALHCWPLPYYTR